MNDFQRGYICAVSCIAAGHGPQEALRALGLKERDWKSMESYDREILEKAGLHEKN